MIWLKRFILMIQFLTRIPVPVSVEPSVENISKGIVFFPVVGVVVGIFMAAGYCAGRLLFFSGVVPCAIAVLFEVMVTGAFHLDGLGDTWDGLFSSRTRERMLEIMKDSRIGTNAAVAIFMDLLVKILVLYELSMYCAWTQVVKVIIMMAVAGRTGMLTACAISSYARKEGGLGRAFVEGTGRWQWAAGTAEALAILLIFSGVKALFYIAVTCGAAFVFTRFVQSRIGGMTGDTLGTANEVCEVIFLLVSRIPYMLF